MCLSEAHLWKTHSRDLFRGTAISVGTPIYIKYKHAVITKTTLPMTLKTLLSRDTKSAEKPVSDKN